jgi:hypothetical protein
MSEKTGGLELVIIDVTSFGELAPRCIIQLETTKGQLEVPFATTTDVVSWQLASHFWAGGT